MHIGTWFKSQPDERDFTDKTEEVKKYLLKIGIDPDNPTTPDLPPTSDWRAYASDIEDQLDRGSCTSHSAIAPFEYIQKWITGDWVDISRLFLYQVTLILLNGNSFSRLRDTGADIRTTMKALSMIGACTEKWWPYSLSLNYKPGPFEYAMANNFKSIVYYRLDRPNISPQDLLNNMRSHVNAGIPLSYGTPLYNSMNNKTGDIPYPEPSDKLIGYHAMSLFGHDDNREIINKKTATYGCFLDRNSWGKKAGEDGWYRIPYEYVLKGKITDIWAIYDERFINTKVFD